MTLDRQPAPVLRTIWREPRATLQRIAHDNPGYGVFVLPVLAGTAGFPVAGLAFGEEAAERTSGYIAQSLLSFSPILELLQLFVATFLISRLALRFQGHADSRRLLSALAWSNLPIVLLAPLSLVTVLLAQSLGVPRASGGLPVTVLLPALAVQVGLIGWAKYLLVIGCADALALSRRRAALCLATAWLLSATVVSAVVLVTLDAAAVPGALFAGLQEAFLGHD